MVSLASDSDLANKAQDVPTAGYDILFTSSNGTSKLSHEIEKFDDATGELVAWVELSSITGAADTEFYMYYGNASAGDQQDPAGTWSSGFEAVYHLHDDFVDSTEIHADATNNGTANIDGMAGDAQNFNGSSQYIDTNFSSNYGASQDFTWSGWFRVDGLNSTDDILGIEDRDTGDQSEIRFSIRDDQAPSGEADSIDIYVRPDGGGSTAANIAVTAPDDGNWHHAALQRNGSTYRIYYDGSEVDSGAIGTGANNSPVTLLIGAQWQTDTSGQRNYFEGDLDEVRTSTTAHSANWILTEYNNLSSPSTFYKPLGGEEWAPQNPSGKYINTTIGTGAATLTFDTAGQNAYWYTDVSYPTGLDDATIASGNYTLNMYFNSLPATWYDSGWSSRKMLTIDSTQVDDNLTNFPVLVSLTDSDLIGNVQADGGDLLFTTSNGTTKLDHEIEKIVPATGQIVAWVELDSVSSTVDTDFYMYYDNPGGADEWNITGTWDSNYVGVWHLDESGDGTLYEFGDSTANNNDGTGGKGYVDYVPAQIGAKIGDGQTFDGLNDFIDMASSGWFDANWPYRKRIVIDGDQVSGTGSHSNFPVLISVAANSDNDLKFTGSGGHVGIIDGTDIFLTNDEGSKLDHEIEGYDPVTGELTLWVEVSGVSTTEDTTLYMYYGYASATDQQNITGTWDAGCGTICDFKGVWHLKEDPTAGAPQFLDSTSNPNDGTSQPVGQEPSQTTGQIDSALAFDDSNERHVEVAHDASMQLGTNITISAWVQTSDAETDVGLIANKWGAAPDRNYWLGKLDASSIAFYVDDAQNVTTDLSLINSGSWHYVVGVADVANSLVRIYVDGTQRNSVAYDGTSVTGTSDFYIGSSSDSIQQEFDGGIDEVRVSGVARSADWIATEWANQNSPSTFYQFLTEEVPSDISLDLTGTAITLEAWVKYDAAAADHLGILSKNGFSDGYRLVVDDPSHPISFDVTNEGSLGRVDTTGTITSDPNWHHIVGTWDGTTMRVYIDGSVDPTTDPRAGNVDSAGKEFWIGHGDHAIEKAWSFPWDGQLDEVRVSDIGRSAEWISTEYNNHENQGTGPGAFLKTLGTLESAPSVDIVVSVYHTKPDGSDPQEIVTSSTVTIDSNTTSPYALAIGNDASGQIFSAPDPRVIRLHVNVAAVSGGGSFSLAYDSGADPSALDTPSVVVPDVTLLLVAVVIFVPLMTFVMTERRRRRAAMRLATTAFAVIAVIGMLGQDVVTAVASPDVFYLHDNATPAASISHTETQSTAQTISTSYALPSVGGGTDQLYIISVAMYKVGGSSATVSSIAGGSLSWSLQKAQCSARIANPRIEIWQAFGSPSSFSATVNISDAVERTSAAISSYSGADSTAPTEGAAGSNYDPANACLGPYDSADDTNSTSLSLTSSLNDSVLYVATHPRIRTITTPDADYDQKAFVSNTSGGDGANLYVHDRTLPSFGTDSADHALSGTADWDMAGLVINPASGLSPTGKYMNNTQGTGAATLAFDTGGQDGYWYSDISYPTGQGDGSIAAGNYTLNMYFTSLPSSAGWWDTTYGYKQQITVTAGSTAVPSGYSTLLAFDHAALVAAGKALNTGDDLRVVFWNGGSFVELDRALDDGSGWDSASTDIWIQTQASIAASGTDTNYYIYYGNSGATGPPNNRSNIFLFWDDFESESIGNVPSAWTEKLGTDDWSVQVDPTDGTNQLLRARNVSDNYVYTTNNLGAYDTEVQVRILGQSVDPSVALTHRYDGVEPVGYRARQRQVPAEFHIWKRSGNCSLGSSAFSIPADTWVIQRARATDSGSDVVLDYRAWEEATPSTFAQVNATDAGAAPACTQPVNQAYERIGIYASEGAEDLFFDDVRVRLYVTPEPTAPFGTEEPLPSVDITVSVHHTDTDGTSPTLIKNASVTISANTANPLAFDLGSASSQAFTEADPQLLRAQMHVDTINGGGSFTLAYDSVADPTNLDTPVLVVPDPSLIFIALALAIPLLTFMLTKRRRRRMAARIISVVVAVVVALSVASRDVIVAVAAPDTFYLHDTAVGAAGWYDPDWGYRNKITVDNTKVSGTADFSYFPVLVSMTESEWADSSNGGKVDQADGGDILFTSSNGTTKLDHEIESYDNTNGALVAWVEVPTLSYNSDTDIYIYYGNTLGVADQWNISGTWDEGGSDNFKAVWHLDEDATGTGTADLYQDSSGNLNHGEDQVTATGQSGQVNGGQEFDGGVDEVLAPDYDILTELTISGWIRADTLGTSDGLISKRTATEVAGNWTLRVDGVNPDRLEWMVWTGSGSSDQSRSSAASLTTAAWIHFALTFDDPTNTTRFYINGGPDLVDTVFTNPLVDNPQQIAIGWAGQSNQRFDGHMDEVRISNSIRSADWIKTEYDNQLSPSSFFKPLGTQETNSISPAGKSMDLIVGAGGSTLTFDTASQDAYWYTDITYPTGQDDATIAAGSYALNMYFSALPAAQSWWDTNYTSRKQLTVSAGASDIPAGYPVRLEFDHAALTTAQSLASGDDIRISYFNGSWTELDRALFDDGISSSSWDSATTTIMFKTEAAISASGSDNNYYMYYDNSGAGSPPTNTPSSRYYREQQLTEFTTTNTTTYQDTGASLVFTPSDTSEHWVVVATWRQRDTRTSGTTQNLGEARVRVNTVVRTGTDDITARQSGDAYISSGAMFKITGTTAQQTIDVQFRAVGGSFNDGIDDVRILAFMIPEPGNADIQYVEDLALVNDTVNPTVAQTLTFAPTSAGDYIWMVNGFHHEADGGGTTGGLFAEDETNTDQQESDESYISNLGEGFVNMMHFEERTLGSGSQTFDIRHQPDTSLGSERQGLTTLLFRSDVFEGVETDDAPAETSTTSSSPQTKVSLTTATQASERDYIYLAVMMHDDSGSITDPSFDDIRHAGNPVMSVQMQTNRGGYDTNITWASAEYTTGNETIVGRYWGSGTSTARATYAHLLALRYKEPASSLGSEEGQSGTVDITVSVHHTKADGSDPQLVTTASTTVDGSTTDPLALDLGAGAEQTFTSADPRMLRVQVHVDSLSTGASFDLAYDSATELSSLDTPTLTVPEFGLILIALVILIPVLTTLLTANRKRAVKIISVMVSSIVALSLLAGQVSTVTAAPDTYYLHDAGQSPISWYSPNWDTENQSLLTPPRCRQTRIISRF